MLASNSHIERLCQLRCNLENFRQGFGKKAVVIGFVDVVERYAMSQAFQNERQTNESHEPPVFRPTGRDRQQSTDDPCKRLAARHFRSFTHSSGGADDLLTAG